jgi:hypothetical protein
VATYLTCLLNPGASFTFQWRKGKPLDSPANIAHTAGPWRNYLRTEL